MLTSAVADAEVFIPARSATGRPIDLPGEALGRVHRTTLLVVGGHDDDVLVLDRLAQEQLAGEKQVSIVPGATHLFEEPGTLEQAARLAAEWFARHLHRRSEP